MSDFIVESIIKRNGGTIVDFDGPEGANVRYHFKDDGMGNHVAIITNPNHLSRLLAIPEGYRLVGAAAAPNQNQPATFAGGINPAPLGDGDGAKQSTVDQGNSGAAAPIDYSAMTEDQLRAEYEAAMGVPARNNMKPETIIAKLEAARSARAM